MKRKIAVISLVVMLVAVGVGYAALTYGDTLDVTGSASSGTFDVRFLPTAQEQPGNVTVSLGNQQNGNADDKITVTATNLIPGVTYSARVYVKNFGSIPAKIVGYTPSEWSADQFYNVVEVLPIDDQNEMNAFVLNPDGTQLFTVKFKLDDTLPAATEGITTAYSGGFAMNVQFAQP